MTKHSVQRKKKRGVRTFSFGHALILAVCFLCVCIGLYLWSQAFTIGQDQSTQDDDDFRPTVGDPPYRIAVDAGHGGSDPGARGVVQESEMNAATAQALTDWLERDPNYIPLSTRESYDVTAKPAERAAAANAQSPDLLLSIHGNSAPEGSTASGFECYPAVPGRKWHQESYYFAKKLAAAMQQAGASLRGRGGIRYIYYLGQTKQLVESSHKEVRDERSFTILEDADCPAVLAEQCFVTSETDVAQFGSESGCKRTARAYYEAICAYFGTTPLPEN